MFFDVLMSNILHHPSPDVMFEYDIFSNFWRIYFQLQFTQLGCKQLIARHRIMLDTLSSRFAVFAQLVINFV